MIHLDGHGTQRLVFFLHIAISVLSNWLNLLQGITSKLNSCLSFQGMSRDSPGFPRWDLGTEPGEVLNIKTLLKSEIV